MRVRASLVFVTTLLLALSLAAPALAQPAALASGQAALHPVHASGIMGSIQFTETNGVVTATGTATGLAPNTVGRYITLVYDIGSVSGGPTACEPRAPMAGMFVGFWISDANGNGVLQFAPDPEDPVAQLGDFDTTSIRDTTINGGFGVEAVQACGQVAFKPAS
jgi:hypothetical protein